MVGLEEEAEPEGEKRKKRKGNKEGS